MFFGMDISIYKLNQAGSVKMFSVLFPGWRDKRWGEKVWSREAIARQSIIGHKNIRTAPSPSDLDSQGTPLNSETG